jgi:hypothetical protein
MVQLAARVGCVPYRVVYWNLCEDYKEDKRNISHKIQTPTKNKLFTSKKYINLRSALIISSAIAVAI